MLEISNAKKMYYTHDKNTVQALMDVTIQVDKNEIVAITGESGAGKSTLLHVLACLLRLDAGTYKIDGTCVENLHERQIAKIRNEKIGVVFQNFLLLQNNTVYENVEIPLMIAGAKRSERQEKCLHALELAGIPELAKRPVNELSGGQKQRVAIARAIANNAEYILADEPTGSLDSETSLRIFDLLCSIRDSGRGVVVVTHDRALAAKCDRQVQMQDGRLLKA